jgi:hypothetical protein
MDTGKAIYYLLKDSDAVGAIVNDRIYPEIAQQDADAPFVAYTITDTTPSGTKSGSSDLDTARVELYMISPDYAECMSLGSAVRGALDRVNGNVGPVGGEVAVQSIDFDSSDVEFDTDQRVYVLEQVYNIRVQRTGTAVSYATIPSNSITVEEFDGTPTGAVNKLIFTNGTVTLAGSTARITSGGSLTIQEADGTPSGTASTIVFPNGTVNLSGSTATLDLSLDTLDTSGILEQIAEQLADGFGVSSSDFPNGLIGDFNQDGYVGSADLLIFITYFGENLDGLPTERAARLTSAFNAGTDAPLDLVRSINSETADREGDVNLSTGQIPEGANLYYTDARVDLRIAAALLSDLSDTPNGIGTAGQVLVVNAGRTGYEFANQPTIPDHSIYVQTVNNEEPDGGGDVTLTTELINEVAPNLYYTDTRFDTRYATKTHYHDRYATEAEAERSGATATLEIYYTARPDGDGYAESEVSDVGETDTINRTLYYATKFEADPDTAGDWTEYTTQPADNATFATAKAALLAGLNDTDATAETRGTLPLSLKMVRTTTAPASNLLLDDYPNAAAAYSVRKLDKDYTGYCMKVREDSGNTEADIGFDGSGDLDTAAIASHCGSANGYVVTWYDQSGNSEDVTQSTGGDQPKIYNGTAVVTDNGKPALEFDGLNDDFTIDNTSLDIGTLSSFMVGRFASTASQIMLSLSGGTSPVDKRWYMGYVAGGNINFGYASASTAFSTTYNTNQNLLTMIAGTTQGNASAFVNGSTLGTATRTTGVSSNQQAHIGAFNNQFYTNGTIQELVYYSADQSSNRTGIESDIDTYFSIT